MGGALLVVLLGGATLYLKSVWDVMYGAARTETLEDIWLPLVDLADITGKAMVAERAHAPTAPAPVLDSLARQWQASVNSVYPTLIVGAAPLRAGDLVVQLHPAYLREVTSEELGDVIQELAFTWRAVLATNGSLWPDVPGFEPGLVVVRPRRTSKGLLTELVAESRDGSTVVAALHPPSLPSPHAKR